MFSFLKLPNDSIKKTLLIALMLCLACSIIVAGAAVLLKPIQASNQALDRKLNILVAAGLYDIQQGGDVDALYEKYVEARIVDLATGDYNESLDPLTYDARKAARNPSTSELVPADKDIASIKRQATQATVYLIHDDDKKLTSIVLPMHGYGLWSTMYGFLALAPDTRTVVGLKFYEHGETPGLGGEIENPAWLAQWPEKIVYDDEWQPAIKVAKGKGSGESEVDGLAGATLTSRGVMYLLQYWLSEQGFGPYLARLRTQENTSG